MIVAAIGAAFLGDWLEGGFLLLLFSLGHALEHYAIHKAKHTISKLGDLLPKKALLKTNNGTKEIEVNKLKIEDVIIVNPDDKIPIDGVVISGESMVNQAAITGESIPVPKKAYPNIHENKPFDALDSTYKVFGGTINEDQVLEIKVLKEYKDTVLQKMIYLVKEANAKKSKAQIFSKKVEKYFVPIILIFVVLLCFAFLITNETPKDSIYRAISVLIASSPCALAISTPSAVLSAIARAAQNKVLIKGGRAIEILAKVNSIAFDKTGTLTYGKPKVTDVYAFNGFEELEVLFLANQLEKISKHPLGKAIFNEVSKQKIEPAIYDFKNPEQLKGIGLKAIWDEKEIIFGKENILENKTQALKELIFELNSEGKTVSFLKYDNECIGLIAFKDLPRDKSKETILNLRKLGIKYITMLTGDSQIVGAEVAKQISIESVKGNLLPSEKLLEINELIKKRKTVAMIGDGVNDAPAMAASHIGVAMGAAGSEIALETAEVALLSDKIEKLPFLLSLSKKAKGIIIQNLIISLLVILTLIPLAAFGITGIGWTVIIHEGSTVLVVFNALRLLRFEYK
ncbi:heavy metal translocating P-type ATPase [Aureivirga sp. CE67]|uniref:heavy metal translocating P-type ATPase n=1 Tax=Aureivirga sp. CE67 TaxID=1788983 RepID=UPI001E2B3AB9|nr:heavy metal translocating P-type ATPase [Aureivirga sp. CE67]